LALSTTSRAGAALVAATVLAALVPAASAAGTGTAVVLVRSISLAGDYGTSHRVYAMGARASCQKDCALLLRSTDGAGHWAAAPARGWTGGEVATARRDGRDAVLAATASGVQVSLDGGATFGAPSGPAGHIAVSDPGSSDAAVSGTSAPALYRVADGSVRTLPAFDLKNALFVLSPAYAAPRGPAALVAGTDPSTGFPVVERCDAAWRCGERTVLLSKKDVPRVSLSPRFDTDGVVVATTVSGTAFLSRDFGATFTPMTVQKPAAGAAITTVQSVAFTPDYDGSTHSGAAYASVLSALKDPDGAKTVYGGVYKAADPGGPWAKFGGASLLDTGSTAVVAAPDGRVYAAYVDALHGKAGVLCARGARWGSGCAFPRAAAAPGATRTPAAPAGTGRPGQSGSPKPAAASAARSPGASAPPAAARPRSGSGSAAPAAAAGLGVLALAGGGVAVVLARRRRSAAP
jgi:hypothetical protein